MKVYFVAELLVIGSGFRVVGSGEGFMTEEEVETPRIDEGEEVGELLVVGCWFEGDGLGGNVEVGLVGVGVLVGEVVGV